MKVVYCEAGPRAYSSAAWPRSCGSVEIIFISPKDLNKLSPMIDARQHSFPQTRPQNVPMVLQDCRRVLSRGRKNFRANEDKNEAPGKTRETCRKSSWEV